MRHRPSIICVIGGSSRSNQRASPNFSPGRVGCCESRTPIDRRPILLFDRLEVLIRPSILPSIPKPCCSAESKNL